MHHIVQCHFGCHALVGRKCRISSIEKHLKMKRLNKEKRSTTNESKIQFGHAKKARNAEHEPLIENGARKKETKVFKCTLLCKRKREQSIVTSTSSLKLEWFSSSLEKRRWCQSWGDISSTQSLKKKLWMVSVHSRANSGSVSAEICSLFRSCP